MSEIKEQETSAVAASVLRLRVGMLLLLAILLVVPIACMNHDPEAISDIDNRRLQTLPSLTLDEMMDSSDDTPFFSAISGYVSDRIGFRSEMIGAYSVLNDRIFGVMTHPSYEYGSDGWVFFRFSDERLDEEFIELYADYILQMQEYCHDRGIEFLYVISPEKSRVYEEYIPSYVSEQVHTSSVLIPMLEERGVNYVDQYDALSASKEQGNLVFNKVFDAGHWNSEGMYAGSQAVIDELQAMDVAVEDIDLADYEKTYTEQTSLLVSNYPIQETTFRYEVKPSAEYVASYNSDYNDGLVLDDIYRTAYYSTTSRQPEETVLMFQGSYYNTQGTMLQNQFSTLATIHDYENVFSLPYYVDVYQPDVVIFENADYTISNSYYSRDALTSVRLPKPLSQYDGWSIVSCEKMENVERLEGSSIASYLFSWPSDVEGVDYSYVVIGDAVYDAAAQPDGRFLWGIPASAISGVKEVTLIGIDVNAGIKYQAACSL